MDIEILDYQPQWQQELINLWCTCGLVTAWNDPAKDIARKLTDTQGKLFLLFKQQKLIGSVMLGYDGHRGSIFYLAISPGHQGQGTGKLLMTHCEKVLKDMGCPKINLCIRDTNIDVQDFYMNLGYQHDSVIVMSKRLLED